MVLFLFLTTGSCEFLRRIILGLGPGCFMHHWCLSFPSSCLNPSDIICNYLKKAEAQEGVSLVNGCNFCAVAAQKLLRLCYLWLPASGKDSFQN